MQNIGWPCFQNHCWQAWRILLYDNHTLFIYLGCQIHICVPLWPSIGWNSFGRRHLLIKKKVVFSTIFDFFSRCSAIEELAGRIKIWVHPVIHIIFVKLDSAKIVIRISYDIMVTNIITIVWVTEIVFPAWLGITKRRYPRPFNGPFSTVPKENELKIISDGFKKLVYKK